MSTTRTDVTPELEAVAKAIYDADPLVANTGKGAVVIRWDELSESQKDRHHRKARAALLAIREPTEGIAEALADREASEDGRGSYKSMGRTDRERYSRRSAKSFTAAIDHVLGEKK